MLGGITPMPRPGELIGFASAGRDPTPIFTPRPMPIEPVANVEGDRVDSLDRGRNESVEPPPIRPGMNPSVIPP